MISGVYREGRSRVTEDIRREVSRLVDNEKDWERKKKHPGRWYRSETAKTLKLAERDNPSLRSYEELLREIRKKSKVENPLDGSWNTVLLNTDPLNPELIPWVMRAQYNRKEFLAKPLTIREVKWFARFIGFKDVIKPPPEMDNVLDLKAYFIINVLATWAQLYAAREKIDSVAGIQELDYSDLDIAMVDNDYRNIIGYNNDKLMNKIQEMREKSAKITQSQWDKYFEEWIKPALIEHIVFFETNYLFHSLGEPDMSQEALKAYGIMLSWNEANYGQVLWKDSYEKRVGFFIRLRQYCRDDNRTINSKMSEYSQWWEDVQLELRKEGIYPFHDVKVPDKDKKGEQ